MIETIILGIITSALAGAYFQPFLVAFSAKWIVKFICKVPFLRGNLTGIWTQTWYVSGSDTWNEKNSSEIRLYHFHKWLFGEWSNETKKGSLCNYKLFGKIEKKNYIIGRWYDVADNGYIGSFMQRLSMGDKECKGLYVGNRTNGKIESFSWDWTFIRL